MSPVRYADEDMEWRQVGFQQLASVRQHPHRGWFLECSKMISQRGLFTKLELAANSLPYDIWFVLEDVALMKAYAVLDAQRS
jgi:hypothetical protein